jgi:hypothetical protein
MTRHISYQELRGHPPDFEIEYEVLPPEEKEIGQRLFQSIRCDFQI